MYCWVYDFSWHVSLWRLWSVPRVLLAEPAVASVPRDRAGRVRDRALARLEAVPAPLAALATRALHPRSLAPATVALRLPVQQQREPTQPQQHTRSRTAPRQSPSQERLLTRAP